MNRKAMTRDDVLQELDRAVHLMLAGKGEEADAVAIWCRETARSLEDRDLVVTCLQFLCGLAMREGFDAAKRIALAEELAAELPAPETLFQLGEAYRASGREADATASLRHAQALLEDEEKLRGGMH